MQESLAVAARKNWTNKSKPASLPKQKNELNLAAVDYIVVDGIVTLTGKGSTQRSKNTVGQIVKEIDIVKCIVNLIK